MLKSLKIYNYAIIDELEIDFSNGMTVITGETGAGKSILLGALGLILGNRSDSSIFKKNDRKCIVEGWFVINDNNKAFFENNDLDFDIETSVRREITPEGKSRNFINDTPVNLNILKEFAELMIDIHSQHQTLRLNNPSFQLAILDSFAQTYPLLTGYRTKYKAYRSLLKKITELEEAESRTSKDYDYIQFQLQEIIKSEILEDEDQKLEEELVTLSNAEKIKSSLDAVNEALYNGDISLNSILNDCLKNLGSVAKFNPRLDAVLKRLELINPEIKDIYQELANFADLVDVDEQRISEISERLSIINHLLVKHQLKNVTELIEYGKVLKAKIDGLFSVEDRIKELNALKDEQLKELNNLANNLSDLRRKHIPQVETELVTLLQSIGMKNASLGFELTESKNNELSENGIDSLNILFSSNKGIPMQAINKVASGGELSRLMLSIKYVLTESVLLPTIIFDEIDLGISGEIAIKVGQMIKKLARNHQVITITHLPQIAAMGNDHLLVYKINDHQSTLTKIKKLDQEERILEIGKMIGGDKPSETNLITSRELLEKLN